MVWEWKARNANRILFTGNPENPRTVELYIKLHLRDKSCCEVGAYKCCGMFIRG
jgi:hypothetical protein